jgi:hypothetical protein
MRVVILNGGEVGLRDRTAAKSWRTWMGNALDACSAECPCGCIAGAYLSYGPSEGLRPPRDDIATEIFSWKRVRGTYLALRISLSKSGFDSSRTRCGYISPP